MCHPDSNPNDHTLHTKFVELQEAYETLEKISNRKDNDQGHSNTAHSRRPNHVWEAHAKRGRYDHTHNTHRRRTNMHFHNREQKNKEDERGILMVWKSMWYLAILVYLIYLPGLLDERIKRNARGCQCSKCIMRRMRGASSVHVDSDQK